MLSHSLIYSFMFHKSTPIIESGVMHLVDEAGEDHTSINLVMSTFVEDHTRLETIVEMGHVR
jgi:hypothetical protein